MGPLGTGFAFPLVPAGRFALVSEAEAVAQALRHLLLTEPGERVRRPGYGCGLRQFLFQPNSVATRTRLQALVSEAITRFEARVRLDGVNVAPDPADDAVLLIDIRYRLVTDPTPQRLALPLRLDAQ